MLGGPQIPLGGGNIARTSSVLASAEKHNERASQQQHMPKSAFNTTTVTGVVPVVALSLHKHLENKV